MMHPTAPARTDLPAANLHTRLLVLASIDKNNLPEKKATGQKWQTLVAELRNTDDTDRIRELIMLLEEAIFYRQQELALHPENINKAQLEQEEHGLRSALDLMLELKSKRLGFPSIP